VEAESLSSATEGDDIRRIWREVHAGRTRLLYVTPERYGQVTSFKEHLASLYRENKIRAFIIDEGGSCGCSF
jgi:superfamily II DNA helicase RecQ